LTDETGKYLAESYQISYAPSLGVLEHLRRRDYVQTPRQPLLAFGGAVYEEPEEPFEGPETEAEFEAELQTIRSLVEEAGTHGGSLRKIYASWLGFAWNPLPGTLQEVASIQQIMEDAEIVTGEQVNEATLKGWSTDGTLANYQVLHFATHGMIELAVPELSALVLSQFATARTAEEDDYLRIGEVAQLKLQADFVNLSACETGLGKIYGGQGVVGLTQSFLLAGANGLSVSLWRVADKPTAQFMITLYQFVAEGMRYPDALAEVKRRFIAGEFGEEWRHPYYWSPFVYYGKD
jgi:CHAT domain-containing protein